MKNLFASFNLILLLCWSCFCEESVQKQDCNYDYYWRDYRGVTPKDAIEAGRDANGTPFYVGQAYFTGKELLPASIFANKSKAVGSAYNKVLETDKHVKILCSQNPENFEWVSTKSEDLHLIVDNSHVVIGGSEVGETLYIGRIFDETQTVIGKIFRHARGNRGLTVPSANGHEANYQSYEVLTYKCNTNDNDKCNRNDDSEHVVIPIDKYIQGVNKLHEVD